VSETERDGASRVLKKYLNQKVDDIKKQEMSVKGR
jgi:hypothetical protein